MDDQQFDLKILSSQAVRGRHCASSGMLRVSGASGWPSAAGAIPAPVWDTLTFARAPSGGKVQLPLQRASNIQLACERTSLWRDSRSWDKSMWRPELSYSVLWLAGLSLQHKCFGQWNFSQMTRRLASRQQAVATLAVFSSACRVCST